MTVKQDADEWSLTFDAVPDLIMILDKDQHIIRANKAMADSLGSTPEELQGLTCYKTVHGTERPPQSCPFTRLLADGLEHKAEVNEERLGGQFLISVSPLFGENGALIGCVHVARNITPLKRTEKALQKAHDELERRVKERTEELAKTNEQVLMQMAELKRSEEALRERLLFEGLLTELSAKFINMPSELIDNKIEQGLQLFANCLEIDQIICFDIIEDTTYSYVTHLYTVPESGPVPTIISNKEFPWMHAKMLRQEIAQIERLEDFPQEAHIDQETYRKLGVKSVLLVPFSVGGRLTCVFSFTTTRKERTWPGEQILRLKLAGEIIANTLGRKQADEAQMESLMQIKRLKTQLESESAYLQSEIKLSHNFEKLIGQSDALKYVLFKTGQVAPTDATTLILGETGTGKELIARAIHNISPRKDRVLIKVNCGALPSNLIASELFGHEKGAFTGAQARRAGRFEVANGSTLFLDEIGELPLDLQAQLLRVLQDGEFERLGSSHTIKVDVRIIASTNRNLKEEVRIGRFRDDLWYRLNVFPITMPPLRERKEDIPLLANWFIDIYAKKYGKSINTIPFNVMKDLQKYPWPGNVRELEHVVERAIITTQGSRLRLMEKLDAPEREEPQNIRKSLMEVERDYIVQVLKRTGWKVDGGNGAAQILGLNPSTLRTRMKKLQIKRPGLPR